jgi:hypothetical protein
VVVVVIEIGETKEEREVVMAGGGTVVSKCGKGKANGGVEVKSLFASHPGNPALLLLLGGRIPLLLHLGAEDLERFD